MAQALPADVLPARGEVDLSLPGAASSLRPTWAKTGGAVGAGSEAEAAVFLELGAETREGAGGPKPWQPPWGQTIEEAPSMFGLFQDTAPYL